MMMKEALDRIHSEIEEALKNSGRKPGDVKLLPVSKTKPLEYILEAYTYGEKLFGENRVPEALEKRASLPSDIELDFIGHIQSNKAGKTPRMFRLLHSVDSLKLARKLDQVNGQVESVQSILLEVNCSGEEAKHGYKDKDLLFRDMDEILKMEHLKVEGFMTMAPWVQDEKIIRNTFSVCRDIRDEAVLQFGKSFDCLSMGMSNDYLVAIEEGSTLVRIGTAIFGNRN